MRGKKVVCIREGVVYWTFSNTKCVVGEVYLFEDGTDPYELNGYLFTLEGKLLGVSNVCNFVTLGEYRDEQIDKILND